MPESGGSADSQTPESPAPESAQAAQTDCVEQQAAKVNELEQRLYAVLHQFKASANLSQSATDWVRRPF
jgi:hypothetical protein